MIDKLIGPVTGLLDKFIEDKDQKARLAHEVATMAQKHALELSRAQLDVNRVEAGNANLFVSGWRPAVGLPPVRDRSLIAIEGLVPARMRPTLAIALFAASLIAMRGYSEFLYFQF